MYEYKATIVKVYDGDSIHADIELGFNTTRKKEPFRLSGIDTPELRGTEGIEKLKAIEAQAFLSNLILNKEVIIKSLKPKDKYGRYLVEIEIDGMSVKQEMLKHDFTREYNGGAKAPWNFEE
jgi:micrococcal nuclease